MYVPVRARVRARARARTIRTAHHFHEQRTQARTQARTRAHAHGHGHRHGHAHGHGHDIKTVACLSSIFNQKTLAFRACRQIAIIAWLYSSCACTQTRFAPRFTTSFYGPHNI